MKKLFIDCFASAFRVSAVVGTSLSFINQTQQILSFTFTGEVLMRIGLNFLVPFLVATYSRYTLIREQQTSNLKRA